MTLAPTYAQAVIMFVEIRFSRQITTRRSGCDLERRSNKMSALRLLKKSRSKRYDVCSDVVRERRLELPRRLSHAPQTCLSTCSSTLADRFLPGLRRDRGRRGQVLSRVRQASAASLLQMRRQSDRQILPRVRHHVYQLFILKDQSGKLFFCHSGHGTPPPPSDLLFIRCHGRYFFKNCKFFKILPWYYPI